jgi:ubiquinone/menaquinone biosynthesis C-methylase UbiE
MKIEKLSALLKILKLPTAPQLSCLDFGCGSGDKVKFLRDCGYNFVGCDIAFKEGEFTIALEKESIIKRISTNPYKLPYPENHFDFVLSDQVFEHVLDYDKALSELSRVMKSGSPSLHIFPSKWKVFEPHTGTPFGGAINFYLWILFWALLGVNKRGHKNISRFAIAKLDYDYIKQNTNFISGSEIRRLFQRSGFTIKYCNHKAIKLSSNSFISKFVSLIPLSSKLSQIFGGRFIIATLDDH